MIDLKNGTIVLENICYTINSKLIKHVFEETFPKQNIRDLQYMHNGYIWYNIYGDMYKDKSILLSLCFSPNSFLEEIIICPYVTQGENKASWSDWSEKQMKEEKALCDNWLKSNYNIDGHKNFEWGSIQSFCDIRSGSSGISVLFA